MRLAVGHTLLLDGSPEDIARLAEDERLIVLSPVTSRAFRRSKAPIAIGTMAAVVVLAALNVAPILTLALVGVAVVFLTRCIDAAQGVETIDGRLLLLIVSMLTLGSALEHTGALRLIVEVVSPLLATVRPIVALALVYALTSILTALVASYWPIEIAGLLQERSWVVGQDGANRLEVSGRLARQGKLVLPADGGPVFAPLLLEEAASTSAPREQRKGSIERAVGEVTVRLPIDSNARENAIRPGSTASTGSAHCCGAKAGPGTSSRCCGASNPKIRLANPVVARTNPWLLRTNSRGQDDAGLSMIREARRNSSSVIRLTRWRPARGWRSSPSAGLTSAWSSATVSRKGLGAEHAGMGHDGLRRLGSKGRRRSPLDPSGLRRRLLMLSVVAWKRSRTLGGGTWRGTH